MDKDRYIQVGVTAMRDPATGDFLPAVPLYIKAEEGAAEAEEALIKDLGHLFALRFNAYREQCERQGITV